MRKILFAILAIFALTIGGGNTASAQYIPCTTDGGVCGRDLVIRHNTMCAVHHIRHEYDPSCNGGGAVVPQQRVVTPVFPVRRSPVPGYVAPLGVAVPIGRAAPIARGPGFVAPAYGQQYQQYPRTVAIAPPVAPVAIEPQLPPGRCMMHIEPVAGQIGYIKADNRCHILP